MLCGGEIMQQKIITYIDHAMILLMLCFIKDYFIINTVYSKQLVMMNIICALSLAFVVPACYELFFERRDTSQ